MPSPSSPSPSNQGSHGTTAAPNQSEQKRETVKIPLIKTGIGGNLPPVPPKVAIAAAQPDPDDNPNKVRKINASTSAAPIRIVASPRIGIVPGGVKPALETKQAEFVPRPNSQLDGWLKVAATGVGAFAVSSLCYTAELVWNVSQASLAGNIVAGAGAVAVIGLGARMLGLLPGASRQAN